VRIAYVGGFWATNVGNAFYNLGVVNALTRAVPESDVYFLPDLASTYWETGSAYDVVEDVDVDLWVFSGPAFSDHLLGQRDLCRAIEERGKRFAFVSVGAWRYTAEEWAAVEEVLTERREALAFVCTRDRRTYELARELPCPVHDGLCGSMFLDDAVAVPPLARAPYVVLNFATRNEPVIELRDGAFTIEPRSAAEPRRRTLRRRGDRTDAPTWPVRIGPYDVVRTRSEPFSRRADTVFDRPNLHYSDMPHGYLAIYKSAEVVFTDRVHTCAATLILGGTARYVSTTDRSRDGRYELLRRIGADAALERPTQLDRSLISAEKEAMLRFLREQLT
jgi:hypothetical protein